MKSIFGRLKAGDIATVRKKMYSDSQQIVPVAVNIEVSLLNEEGQLVASLQGVNTSINVCNDPSYSGMTSGYDVDFSITIPDNIVVSSDGESFSVIIKALIEDEDKKQVKLTLQDSLEIYAETDEVYGAQPAVMLNFDMEGTISFISYSNDLASKDIQLSLYYGNELIKKIENVKSIAKITGSHVDVPLSLTATTPVSIMPYAILWKVGKEQHIAPMYVFNPSMTMAMQEVHAYVNKNCSDWATKELTFTPEQLAAALWNGCCQFNSLSPPTNFTMTNALSSTRFFWIQYAALWVLRTQILNSVETDFTYTNSSITLDVDRASKYQQYADDLQSRLDEQAKAYKSVLAKRGNLGGDGSADATTLAAGAMGTTVITLSPVTRVGMSWSPYSWRAAFFGNVNPITLL